MSDEQDAYDAEGEDQGAYENEDEGQAQPDESSLQTIEGEVRESAEEGSNTVQPSEGPDVISSFTEQPTEEATVADMDEEQDRPGSKPGSRPGSRAGSAAAETSRPSSSARPASARPTSARPGSRAGSSSAAAPAPLHEEADADAEGGAAEEEAPGSRPGSSPQPPAAPGSVHGSRQGSMQGSRPGTAQQGSRPGTAQQGVSLDGEASPGPEGEAQVGSRPGTAQQGSRPGSSGQQGEAAEGLHASGSLPGSISGSAPGSAAGSRPGTAQHASRPGSSAAAADAPLMAVGSRPGSQQNSLPTEIVMAGSSRPGSTKPGSRPGSTAAPLHVMQQPPPSPHPPAQSPSRPVSVQAEQRPASRPTSTTPPQDPAPSSTFHHTEHYLAPGLKAIDVEIVQGPGLPYKMIRVLLDYTQQDTKPYFGGFKNKRTGAVYHHAGTQTPRQPKYANAEPKLERQTQTVKLSTRTQQTVREAATQMERPGVLVDTTGDRFITPGRYQTSEERLAIVTAAVCTIQRYTRGWIGRKRAAYLRSKKLEREAFLREQELRAQQEADAHRRREIERRMHPRTAADFEILYNELEGWRLQETARIKAAGLPKEKEQEVLQQLLHKETKLLQTIDRLKINANHENKEVRIQKTLGEMGKPKKFELKNGNKVEVHTPFTTRARELQQLYNGLNLPLLTIDERLDVLLHVKWTVKEFDCNLTREIVELIDREADLLNRGRSSKMLEGLRKRISSLFLTFIETPEFNPEAARFQIVPMDFETYLFEKLEKSSARATATAATQW